MVTKKVTLGYSHLWQELQEKPFGLIVGIVACYEPHRLVNFLVNDIHKRPYLFPSFAPDFSWCRIAW